MTDGDADARHCRWHHRRSQRSLIPPMLNYRLTPDAQFDLINIRRYTVKQWGETQSNKYLFELHQTIRLLTETPSLGKPRPDVGEKVLSYPHVSHVIYYVVHNQQLAIFGVLHKRMVPMNHLDRREVITA